MISGTCHISASVLPAVSIVADVPQPNRRIGHNLMAGLASSFAEREVFSKIPVSVAMRQDHRLKPWDNFSSKFLIAQRKLQFELNVHVDFTSNQEKSRTGMPNFVQTAVCSKHQLVCAGQH